MKVYSWIPFLAILIIACGCGFGATETEKTERNEQLRREIATQDSLMRIEYYRGWVVNYAYHSEDGSMIVAGDVGGAAAGGGVLGFVLLGPMGAIAGSAIAAEDEASRVEEIPGDQWLLINVATADSDTTTFEVLVANSAWVHPDSRRFGNYVRRYSRDEPISLHAMAFHMQAGMPFAIPVRRSQIRPITNISPELIYFDDEPIPYIDYNPEDR